LRVEETAARARAQAESDEDEGAGGEVESVFDAGTKPEDISTQRVCVVCELSSSELGSRELMLSLIRGRRNLFLNLDYPFSSPDYLENGVEI